MKKEKGALEKFFYPESICIASASAKKYSKGYEIIRAIKNYGYGGKVFPINPKAGEILGYTCYHTIGEIGEKIDLAIIMVPKGSAEAAVDSLIAGRVTSMILFTAGFKETGKEGAELEQRITGKIKDSGARLVGPNCMGVINTLDDIRLNATFAAGNPETGATGFFSQSGASSVALLNALSETDIKFAHFISAGNKADINENDILEFWQGDGNIKIAAFYLESFEDGLNFILPSLKGEREKPVIVLKAGRTESGMKAAVSHTGALCSNDKVTDALLKQAGIIRAEDLNEMFNTAGGFENFPIPKGKRVAVITNAGGPAILCVDSLEKEGLELAVLSEETKKDLRTFVHPEGSVENPVDLLPGGTAETFKHAAALAAADINVDAVISIFVEPVMVKPFEVVEEVNSLVSDKPILQVVMPLPEFWERYGKNSERKLPLYRNPEDPPEVLANMLFFDAFQNRIKRNFNNNRSVFERNTTRNNLPGGFLPPPEIDRLCEKYNLPLVKNGPFIKDGQNSAQRVIDAGHELLIRGFRDPSFGPVIMFGSGGKYAEIFGDTAVKSCYLCGGDIDDMIDSTKIGMILKGVRGEAGFDLNELKRIINSCSRIMIENEDIIEFEINPLLAVSNNRYDAADVKIKFTDQ